MKSRCRSFSVFLLGLFCLFAPLAASSAVAQSKAAPQADGGEPQAPEQTTEVFENLTEHFEGDTDQRGFPMNFFPAGTHGGLVLAALGAGAVGGLLALGGGSIAIVDEKAKPALNRNPMNDWPRRVGRLGVFGLGTFIRATPADRLGAPAAKCAFCKGSGRCFASSTPASDQPRLHLPRFALCGTFFSAYRPFA